MALTKTRCTLVGMALGAAGAYYFDPDRGRSRRAQHRDQLISKGRSTTEDIEQRARYRRGQLEGARARADGRGQLRPQDDVDIKQGVQQELSRTGVDVADVVIDVTDGVVGLRGQVTEPADQKVVELAAAGVPGVEQVDSWLHLPGQPAPNKAASRRAG